MKCIKRDYNGKETEISENKLDEICEMHNLKSYKDTDIIKLANSKNIIKDCKVSKEILLYGSDNNLIGMITEYQEV